jgi:hypothetical protein
MSAKIHKKAKLLPEAVEIPIARRTMSASSLMEFSNQLPKCPSVLPDGTVLDVEAQDPEWKDVDFPERKEDKEAPTKKPTQGYLGEHARNLGMALDIPMIEGGEGETQEWSSYETVSPEKQGKKPKLLKKGKKAKGIKKGGAALKEPKATERARVEDVNTNQEEELKFKPHAPSAGVRAVGDDGGHYHVYPSGQGGRGAISLKHQPKGGEMAHLGNFPSKDSAVGAANKHHQKPKAEAVEAPKGFLGEHARNLGMDKMMLESPERGEMVKKTKAPERKEQHEMSNEHIRLNEETGEVQVSEDIHELLDLMVQTLESIGYEVEPGMEIEDFVEQVGGVLESGDEDLDEEKGLALEKAVNTIIDLLGEADESDDDAEECADSDDDSDDDEKKDDDDSDDEGKKGDEDEDTEEGAEHAHNVNVGTIETEEGDDSDEDDDADEPEGDDEPEAKKKELPAFLKKKVAKKDDDDSDDDKKDGEETPAECEGEDCEDCEDCDDAEESEEPTEESRQSHHANVAHSIGASGHVRHHARGKHYTLKVSTKAKTKSPKPAHLKTYHR